MRAGPQLVYLAELHGLDRAAAAERAERWLDRLGVAGRAGDRVEELSLGNQQRVQLAAALASGARPTADRGAPARRRRRRGGRGARVLGTLLLYIGIFTFAYYVAAGVVEEKSSRVVEIVLSAIRPAQLLAGKVIGIGVLGLLQLALLAVVGVGAAVLTGEVDLPSTTATTLVLIGVYFVLGYAFYACMFAVAGAHGAPARRAAEAVAGSPPRPVDRERPGRRLSLRLRSASEQGDES
jgi:ABC-type Na+ efflux pump permease subunit